MGVVASEPDWQAPQRRFLAYAEHLENAGESSAKTRKGKPLSPNPARRGDLATGVAL